MRRLGNMDWHALCHRGVRMTNRVVRRGVLAFATLLAIGALGACSSGSGDAASAGAAGTAGSSGSGGNGGSGGSGGSGGTSPGTVTLVLEIAPGTSYCQSGGCGPVSSIAIKDASGTFIVRSPGDCYTPCETCQMQPCPGAACELRGYDVPGETLTWDGTSWLGSTCGATQSCLSKSFAAPGQYVAVMCATPGTLQEDASQTPQCVGTGADECVEVPFEFPSTQTFTGTLGN